MTLSWQVFREPRDGNPMARRHFGGLAASFDTRSEAEGYVSVQSKDAFAWKIHGPEERAPVGTAEEIKDRIKGNWSVDVPYYDEAEGEQAKRIFWGEASPFKRRFDRLDTSFVVELACGRGRHAEHILQAYPVSGYAAVDVNERNIEACNARLGADPRASVVLNNGRDLSAIGDKWATSLFSYDSMVHFEYDDVLAYLGEFFRVLRPGGKALIHHSNNDRQPGNECQKNYGWRNFMSAPLLAHAALRAGFHVIDQELIDWAGEPRLDCITFLGKP